MKISDIYIPYVSSLEKIYVKINSAIVDSFKNFTIKVETADINRDYREIKSQRKTNLIEIPAEMLSYYLQIIVKIPPDKVINDLEVYAMYGEKTSELYIDTYHSGSFTTKVYDTGIAANYRLSSIVGNIESPSEIEFYIRGLRERQ